MGGQQAPVCGWPPLRPPRCASHSRTVGAKATIPSAKTLLVFVTPIVDPEECAISGIVAPLCKQIERSGRSQIVPRLKAEHIHDVPISYCDALGLMGQPATCARTMSEVNGRQ